MGFIVGVIEGFYGRPWLPAQRAELAGDLARWIGTSIENIDSVSDIETYRDTDTDTAARRKAALTGCYMYAPKDDALHRALWRDLYTGDGLEALKELCKNVTANGCQVIYAVAPGLDICTDGGAGEAADLALLEAKLGQLWDECGVRSFAVLFDDIDDNLVASEPAKVAAAQARVANAVLRWARSKTPAETVAEGNPDHIKKNSNDRINVPSPLAESVRVFFCPTQYCGFMATPSVKESPYLRTLGKDLLPEIDFFWTGPDVISREITVDSIQELRSVILRRPTIWDNLHANDYDMRRVYMGPYSGRDATVLAPELAGVLTNPNCEYEANYVPIQTLCIWAAHAAAPSSLRVYDPSVALRTAALEWHERRFAPAAANTPHGALSFADVELLCDCFHLPFAHGARANLLIQEFDTALRAADREDLIELRVAATSILQFCDSASALFERMTELGRRELCYSLYKYLWELKEETDLIRQYVTELSNAKNIVLVSGQVRSYFHQSQTYRGGFVADLQRRLRMLSRGHFAHSAGPSSSDAFIIRPASVADAPDMYRVCLLTGNSGDDGSPFYADPEVLGERWVGPYLFLEPGLAYVLEDPAGIVCGYVLAALDTSVFYEKCRADWFRKMAAKHPIQDCKPDNEHFRDADVIRSFHSPDEDLYFPPHFAVSFPSHLHIDLIPRAQGRGLGKKMIAHILRQLRDRGSRGVFLEMGPTNHRALHFYSGFGFEELERSDDTLFLSKHL